MAQSRVVLVLYEHATESADSEQWAAIWAADETQLAGAETALRGFWENYLDCQVGEMH